MNSINALHAPRIPESREVETETEYARVVVRRHAPESTSDAIRDWSNGFNQILDAPVTYTCPLEER